MNKIRVICIGTKARELLEGHDFSAQVLAIVSNAAYVTLAPHVAVAKFSHSHAGVASRGAASDQRLAQSPTTTDTASSRSFDSPTKNVAPLRTLLAMTDSEIIWLTQNDVKHQRAMVCQFDASALRVGMRFERGMLLNWQNATMWKSATIEREQVAPRAMIARRVGELIDSLGDARGFAQLIPLIRANATTAPTADAILNAAMKPISEIARAWRNRDMARAIETGRALIGLGWGLTPSGDDFIGGMLFAAHSLNAAFPGLLDWKQKSIHDLLAWGRDKTNSISYTILGDHANGQSVDALHNLINPLLAGKDLNELMSSVRRLIGIGSTSGWDMFAGILTGLFAID